MSLEDLRNHVTPKELQHLTAERGVFNVLTGSPNSVAAGLGDHRSIF